MRKNEEEVEKRRNKDYMCMQMVIFDAIDWKRHNNFLTH